jgi:iron complex outermembrane receptor protein
VSRDKSEDLPERVLIKELSGRKVMSERLPDNIIPLFVRPKRHAGATLALLCLSCFSGTAQDMFSEDTINITAVTVTAAASQRQSPFTVSRIDSVTVAMFEGEDLATLLNSAGSLTVRRYGNTGLASVLVRGMSGSHTLITWNGLPVSPPSNGSGDFAIIPVMQRSSVRLTAGGSDLTNLSGAIGGKIELSADPDFSRGTDASVSLGAGSYNDYSTALTVQSGSDRISAAVTAWGVKARNDFIFINPNSPGGETRERRTNSSYSGSGAMTDLSLRLKQSTLSAHVWYSDYDRELPGPVTTVQQDFGETQNDRSLRSVLNYSFTPGRFTAEVTAGESYDINLYSNETYGTEGDNRSGIYLLRSRLSYRPGNRIELVLNAGDEYQWARSLSFEETEWRNIVSASLAARYSPVTRIRLLLQARQMVVTGTRVKPEITAAASFLVTGDGKHILKLNVSRNSQLPCLNDLYWMPGGNAGLMPETSTGGEAGYSYAGRNSKGWRNTFDITVHRSGVENLIQWIPGETGLWSARNVRSVLVTGLESRLGTEMPLKNGSLASYLNYTLTGSVIAGSEIPNDRSAGSQLIYTPLNHLDINVVTRWRFVRAGFTGLFESRRYITSDNSEWLPAVFIADANIGAVFNVFSTVTSLNFRINNLAGTSYASVSNYPMPLRTCTVRLNVSFTNKR